MQVPTSLQFLTLQRIELETVTHKYLLHSSLFLSKRGAQGGEGGKIMPKEPLQHFPTEHMSQCVNMAV